MGEEETDECIEGGVGYGRGGRRGVWKNVA
jgi:hypothetical protein